MAGAAGLFPMRELFCRYGGEQNPMTQAQVVKLADLRKPDEVYQRPSSIRAVNKIIEEGWDNRLQDDGLQSVLLVSAETNNVLDGAHRVRAARRFFYITQFAALVYHGLSAENKAAKLRIARFPANGGSSGLTTTAGSRSRFSPVHGRETVSRHDDLGLRLLEELAQPDGRLGGSVVLPAAQQLDQPDQLAYADQQYSSFEEVSLAPYS
jgi:hypothetical protein